MNPRNRNALLTLVVIMVMAAIVMPLARRESSKPYSNIPQRVAHNPRHAELRGYTEPTTNFLGQAVPLSAIPYLVTAVRCAKQVDQEADKYPVNTNPYRLLKALGQRLFEDDYAYAALGVAGMSRTNALEAYAQLNQQPIPHKIDPLPPKEVSAALEGYYGGIVRYGHTGAYSNLVEILAKYTDQNPLASDLFKDAGLLSVMEQQSNKWMAVMQKQATFAAQVQTEQFGHDPTLLSNVQSGFVAAQQQQVDLVQQLQNSYRGVFAYRLAERHGLTDPAMINELAAVNLGNAGPELVIPVVE